MTVQREALRWNTLPKSIESGANEMLLPEKTQRRSNLTGSTWFCPFTVTGIFMVHSSYSSLGAISSFYLTKYF